jgi:hypothetical protein
MAPMMIAPRICILHLPLGSMGSVRHHLDTSDVEHDN